jgi:hypothetical protein
LGKYLGREYGLNITRGEQPAVKLIAPFLIVRVPKSPFSILVDPKPVSGILESYGEGNPDFHAE